MLIRSFSLAAATLLSLAHAAFAQQPGRYAQPAAGTVTPAMQPAAGSYVRVSGRSNPAASFYGGTVASAYSALPPRPLPPPRPVNIVPNAKPFSGAQQASAISPYLGLDAARETEGSLPNYYTFVKPALDQQRTNQVQQAQYRRLQQQVRTAAAPGVATNPNGGIPTTGYSDRFMNRGGYYPSLPR